jgi:hypothetical protein
MTQNSVQTTEGNVCYIDIKSIIILQWGFCKYEMDSPSKSSVPGWYKWRVNDTNVHKQNKYQDSCLSVKSVKKLFNPLKHCAHYK